MKLAIFFLWLMASPLFGQTETYTNAPADAPPVAQIATVLNQVIFAESAAKNGDELMAALTGINVSHCPDDFKTAWKTFIDAAVDCQVHNNFNTVGFALLDMLHGATNKLATLTEEQAKLKASIFKLHAVCAQYGIESSYAIK